MKFALNQTFLQSNFPDMLIQVFDSLGSTQDYLKAEISKLNQPTLCLAEQQTAGRGRGHNRQWVSPFASNIYLSYLWLSELPMQKLEGLSLVIGLAIAAVLNQYGINAQVKWPNDVFCHDKKIAGILIEAFKNTSGTKVIIGMGLNVNMTDEMSISQAWTSMQLEAKKTFDRNEILLGIIHKLNQYLKQFEQGALAAFLSEWQKYDYLYSKTLSLETSNQIITGKAIGINSNGLLMIQLPDGKIMNFASGEAKLKK